MELLEILEREKRRYTFAIFSSAETLTGLGDLDLLVRLGVTFVWIGVESKREIYEKNKGVNFHRLVRELRRRGIAVMASAILFLEEHDKRTIWEDIAYASSLKADYLQFMQLGPVPGTALYASYREQGKLLPGVPHRAQHGQRAIWFRHAHFTPDESREILRQAFVHDYREGGPSMLRAMQTTLQGYEYCRTHPSPAIRERAGIYRPMLGLMRYFLTCMRFHCRGGAGSALLREVRAAFDRLLGRQGLKTRLLSLVVLLLSIKERLRIAWFSDVRQPRTLYCIPKKGLRIVGAGR
jgi:hypothetical protein